MMSKITNEHYMYVLACADNTLYTGYTTDLLRREAEHNAGRGAKYTKPGKRRPCQMIFSKAFTTKSEAMSAEYYFKQLTKANKQAKLEMAGVPRFELGKDMERIDIRLEE